MCNKFIKTGDASAMLEPYLSVITKGSCPNDDDGLLIVKDFDPRLSYVASPISGEYTSWFVVKLGACFFFWKIHACVLSKTLSWGYHDLLLN